MTRTGSSLKWECRFTQMPPARDDALGLGMESYFSDDRGWNPAVAQRNSQAALCATDNFPTTTQPQAQTATWQVANLRPHPSYARLGISVSASRLSALLDLGNDAFLSPLIVTSTGIVIDGYARLEWHGCKDARLSIASNITFLRRRLFVGFCFVTDHLPDWRLSVELLWPEGLQNLSKKRRYNTSRPAGKRRVRQNRQTRKGLTCASKLQPQPAFLSAP